MEEKRKEKQLRCPQECFEWNELPAEVTVRKGGPLAHLPYREWWSSDNSPRPQGSQRPFQGCIRSRLFQ